MMSLAALVLGSSLMVTADAVEPPPPDPRALKRVRHAERHRRTMVAVNTIVAFGGDATRNQQLYTDTAFIAGSAIGTVMQVWGALTAPPRNVEATTHALRVAPACGPTAGGGAVCGLALAGF